MYTGWISNKFKLLGNKTLIHPKCYLIGGKYISINYNCSIGARAYLTAWDEYGSDIFRPKIIIGHNVSIGEDSHISAISRIEIGNNVLMGKKITIIDNAHGNSCSQLLPLPPAKRPLYSAGPVIIESGVWIGDKVTVLPNVRIGRNAIIGANAVVTHDIPENCIAVGIPAKVIKLINQNI